MVVLLAFSSPTSQPPVSTLSTHSLSLFLSAPLSLARSLFLSHPSIPASSCPSLRFNPSTSLPLPSFVAVRPTRAPTTSVAFHRRHRLAALPFPTLNLAVDEPTTPLVSNAVESPALAYENVTYARASKFVLRPALLPFPFLFSYSPLPLPSFFLSFFLPYLDFSVLSFHSSFFSSLFRSISNCHAANLPSFSTSTDNEIADKGIAMN